MGVYGLAVGAVGGALAHLLVQAPGLARRQARYRLSLSLHDRGVREVMRLMGPRMLGLLFVQLHFLVNTSLASGLQPGSVAALNYAWLLMLLPLGVFAQAIGTAVFPTFAAQVALGQEATLRLTFAQILRTVLFLTLPAAVGLLVLRVPLVQALLEHGEFGPESTALVAVALRAYALGLVAHALVEIGVRAFYALHNTWTPVLVGVAAMALNVMLSLILVRWLALSGLALANSTATTLEMLCLLWLLARRLGGLELARLGGTLVRSAVAAALMAAALVGWLGWVAGQPWPPELADWLKTLGGIGVAAVVYLAVGLLLGSHELAPFARLARHRANTRLTLL
jgi:putative peptidoglycan lipid II flippase